MELLHHACSQSFSLEQKCVELMDSYATLLFAKISEIKPEEFRKQYGLCRDTALFSGVGSDSTCVFCHHLLDEIMSKLKDPDSEVIALCEEDHGNMLHPNWKTGTLP